MIDLFDKKNMLSLRGIAALVVVMVHILPQFQNPVQDAIGSFAYIAVTYFFFASAYGMEYSFDHNPDYLHSFWKGRLVALLVPMVAVNIIYAAYDVIYVNGSVLSALFRLNHYVYVLLQYCFAFYLIHLAGIYFKLARKSVIILLAATVFISSLIDYFFFDMLNWSYERMGLVWGMIAYFYKEKIEVWFSKRISIKFFICTAVCVFMGLLYIKFKSVYFAGEYVLKIILGLAFIVFIFLFSSKICVINPLTEFFGKISYPVYLSHDILMMFIAKIAPDLISSVFIVITYLVTIIVSYIVLRVTDPVIRLLRQ